MATAAQIEANRRNIQRSTGPRTEEVKNRSRMNALDHGCRSNILVMPSFFRRWRCRNRRGSRRTNTSR